MLKDIILFSFTAIVTLGVLYIVYEMHVRHAKLKREALNKNLFDSINN